MSDDIQNKPFGEEVSPGWRKYHPDSFKEYAVALYQKILWHKNEKLGINLYEYSPVVRDGVELMPRSWALEIQIPSEISITGQTIDVNNFGYRHSVSLEQVENHGKTLIYALTKEYEGLS